MVIQPKTVAEVQTAVQEATRLVVRGGGTKPALSAAQGDTAVLSTKSLSGILAYEPDEYTFTAYAGTAVADIAAALAENGQYLPFDPIFVGKGATLGGTAAANLSGSGRYRYGGVRDFILGIAFVDGQGQLVHSGGKVVKNSAGFDLPKFMVGSLGRYGVLVEVTFKVFPQPHTYVTMQLDYPSLDAALQATFKLAVMPFEMDVLDLLPGAGSRFSLIIRLGGLPDALPGRVTRMRAFLQEQTEMETAVLLENAADAAYWQAQNRFDWVNSAQALVKVPLAPKQIPLLDAKIDQTGRRYTAGGNVAWIATTDIPALQTILTDLNLVGLQLTGHTDNPYLGRRKGIPLAQRVKQALDPLDKFGKES
ncbi:MAG: FAD-binding protein [Anaerolineales bacterium]|nr:FAD-binding protein [Anaerolineales bacterium]